MNDEIEEVETTEEVETPAAPAWDFSPPAQQPPQQITPEMVAKIVAEQLQAHNQQREVRYEDEIINKAVETATQRMMQIQAQQMAPIEAERLTNKLTKDLPEASREYVENFLSKFDASGIAMLKGDKDTLDLIRRAAEFEGMKGKPIKGATAPRSESTQTVEKHTDSKITAEVDKMWAQGFKNIPGMTKEILLEKMQAASKGMN